METHNGPQVLSERKEMTQNKMKWISVKERLPEIDKAVIAGRFTQSARQWITEIIPREFLEGTYWQYWLEFDLPESPKEG